MRYDSFLKNHKVNAANAKIEVGVVASGVEYDVMSPPQGTVRLSFSHRQVDALGVSAIYGLTPELLLALALDHIESNRTGREDALACTKIEEALHRLRAKAL